MRCASQRADKRKNDKQILRVLRSIRLFVHTFACFAAITSRTLRMHYPHISPLLATTAVFVPCLVNSFLPSWYYGDDTLDNREDLTPWEVESHHAIGKKVQKEEERRLAHVAVARFVRARVSREGE